MASLRVASPRLRNYFKENYIPQVCEALLCGILVTCPEDPLRYLEEMITAIMENGLESLLWDMCIDPSTKPRIRKLSETYLEQLFGLDDQLVTPELMIKACTFYAGRLLKTHFYTWRERTIPPINEDDPLAEKMEKAAEYYNFRLQRYVFRHWHSYVKAQKEQLRNKLLRIQQMFQCCKLIIILNKWRDKARYKNKKRENELMLKHELQLRKWRSKLKLKVNAKEESICPKQDISEVFHVDEIPAFDISQLPKRAILQNRFGSCLFVRNNTDITLCSSHGILSVAQDLDLPVISDVGCDGLMKMVSTGLLHYSVAPFAIDVHFVEKLKNAN